MPGQQIGQQHSYKPGMSDTPDPHGYARSLYPCGVKRPIRDSNPCHARRLFLSLFDGN